MAHDKITVDEPLISTDVDSLIRTIAERKRVALSELRQLCRIDKKTMDKWIAVLEDEGYIVVEYGLRGTNIIWRGLEEVVEEDDAVTSAEMEKDAAHLQEVSPDHSEPEPPAPGMPGLPVSDEDARNVEPQMPEEEVEEAGQELAPKIAASEEPEPEELLSEYLAKKRSGEADIDSIKLSILTNLEDSKKGRSETEVGKEEAKILDNLDVPSDEHGDSLLSTTDVAGAVEEGTEAHPAEDKTSEPALEAEPQQPAFAEETQTLRPTSKGKVATAEVRELMNSYLAEINKEKARIEALKKEREALYREKFATMEGKMQADIVVFTEKIIEKESKIAELKERVLELPDKVDELNRLQEQLDVLKKEGREALQRTKVKTDEFLVGVGESKAQVEEKISQVSAVLEAQETRLRELEKLSMALDARSEKLKASLDTAKAQLEELSGAMSSLVSDLQQVEQMKLEAAGLTETIKQTVAAHGEELRSLEQELEGIERTEHWVQEYIRDYEQKIEDIEQYVSKSEDEMVALRESAEALYLNKYLGELESMTDAYQDELHDAVSREKEIEMKIAESRSRIAELVSESQEMIKKLRSESSQTSEKDFGVLMAKVKAHTQRTKNIVDEKQQERAKLIEESQRTRKTVKPVSRAEASKPAAKKAALKSVPAKKKKK